MELTVVGQKYHCDNCQANVTDSVRISCVECEEFDLCATCFSKGIEIGEHRNNHPYRVVTRHRFPIFTEDWSADEELLLIDGLRQFGMGNWKDAAEHVGTKTKEECEQHYIEVYVNSDSWPLPDLNKHFDKQYAVSNSDKRFKSTSNKSKILSSQPSNHEIVGYMPGRLEFETEYENEAEQIVKDMVFNSDDSSDEIELKLIVLGIYNGKLDRRLERKNFIFERGLLEYRKNQAIEKKRPKDERDLLNKAKVFARMQSKKDFEEFSTGILNEHMLRQHISQLQEWRRNGITTMDEGAQFEIEKSQRLSRRANTARDSTHLIERLQKIVAARTARDSGADLNNHQSNNNHKSSARSRTPLPPVTLADIEKADGVELLNSAEKDLCMELRIYPHPYLVAKEAMLAEYARRGALKCKQACELVKIDEAKATKLYELFVDSGWIKNSPYTNGSSQVPGISAPNNVQNKLA